MFLAKSELYLRELDKIVSHLLNKCSFSLSYSNFDLKSLSIIAHSDASNVTKADLNSQLVFVLLLVDSENVCQPIHWTSYKSKRGARSVLGSKVIAFSDAFYMGYSTECDLQTIPNQPIPLSMMTDSVSLFAVLTKSSTTTEKTLMIDIQTVKESYRSEELNNVAFIRFEHNMADALIKVKSHDGLTKTMINRKIEYPIEQWIIQKHLKGI